MIASLINLFTMRVLALDCFVKKVQLWYNNYTVRLVSKMNIKTTYSSRENEHISWVERYLNVPLCKWGACSVTAGMIACGKENFQKEIPDQQAHMHSRSCSVFISQYWGNMKCLYISSFRLTVTKTTCGISLQLGTDVCQVMPRGKWDSGPMPQAAAPHGTELVWDSRTHRTMYINIKCSPLLKVDKILASQK